MEMLVLRDLDVRHVGGKYARVLEQLRQGDFRSAEVKKLQGSGLYRARLDEKDRLLFRLGEHGGRRYLLVLEVVRNHDYSKARFLNGGAASEDDFVAVHAGEAESAEPLAYVNPGSPALHVLDKPLSFDDAQTSVFETPPPLIVIGSAGSGKTALTLEKLKTLPGHGLYLTRSSFLVDNARSLYYSQGYANEGQEIDFLSLAELIETIDAPPGRQAVYADFAAWHARMRGFKLREPHKIFEEINGVITGSSSSEPWMSEAEYLDLGIRQSIFLGDERRAVYQVFERWLQHLRENGLYDPNVAAWERRSRAAAIYDFLVIDEVQDITGVELRLALATLKDRQQFVLCGDSNQIVHPNLFSWARVKSLFYGDDARGASPLDRIHILRANYRNTRAVTALANRLLLVKQKRFGSIDRESHYLVESVSGEDGRVELVADSPEQRAEIDAKTRRSTRYAVVVLRDEDKPEARAAFGTPLVFSVQEAKGLEYEHVVLFNLVSGAAREFADCCDGVGADSRGELGYSRARDKTDKSLDAYKFYVNALYVAMTRAVKTLLLVERETSHPLWELLAVERMNQRVELVEDTSTREEWQREARKLELQGKAEQAEQIRREILEAQPVPWEVIDATTFDAIKARAIGPGPRDKEAQQLLFEYALTCDAPDLLAELLAAGFRHARNAESGRAFLDERHHADYRLRRPLNWPEHVRRHGVDFRNPLGETPLMVAARVARADVVRDLLGQGADPELFDCAGRTPLRFLLAAWIDNRAPKRAALEAYSLLADHPIKTRVGARMAKLDPRSIEWFLLNLVLVTYRRTVSVALRHGRLPTFTAASLEEMLRTFPERVVPLHRQRRAYISSALARNEVASTNPYSRRLLCRAAFGRYVLNPALEIEVKGEWLAVNDLMGLSLLLRSLAPRTSTGFFERWMGETRQDVAQHYRSLEAPLPVPAAPVTRP